MKEFVRQLIGPIVAKRGWTSVCEIGVSRGLSTDRLLRLPNVSVTVVDPGFDLDLAAKYAGNPRVKLCKGNSLDVLPALDSAFDCILIDGDHNWYTVYNELRVIFERQLLRPGGMIFFHDVEWPYGRRDMYCQPGTIPGQYRHPYARGGTVRGRSELSADSGLDDGLWKATHEGGPRNGVLTAVEDFWREHRRQYQFALLRREAGLGAIHYRRDLVDDFRFAAFQCRASAYNLLTSPKRFARTHFPTAYMYARSTLGRT